MIKFTMGNVKRVYVEKKAPFAVKARELKEEISGVKAKLASGEQPVFDSVDALFDKLEAD